MSTVRTRMTRSRSGQEGSNNSIHEDDAEDIVEIPRGIIQRNDRVGPTNSYCIEEL